MEYFAFKRGSYNAVCMITYERIPICSVSIALRTVQTGNKVGYICVQYMWRSGCSLALLRYTQHILLSRSTKIPESTSNFGIVALAAMVFNNFSKTTELHTATPDNSDDPNISYIVEWGHNRSNLSIAARSFSTPQKRMDLARGQHL